MLRAEEIAKSSDAGSDWENWLRAEQEHKAYHARLDEQVQRIAASPEAALGRWLRAEQELGPPVVTIRPLALVSRQGER